ncbi:MAG: polysaccharide biosynthesis C-terminal domain-containing protein [Clostridia bacterium]
MNINKIIGVGLSEIVAKILSWLSLAIIPFFASPEIYGQIILYYSVIVFFLPIYLFGQDRLILKNNPEQELLNSTVFSVLIWVFISYICYFFDYILPSIAGLILAINKIYITYFRSVEDLKKYAYNRILYSVLRILFIFIVVFFSYSLVNYVFAEILSALIVTLGLFVIFYKSSFGVSFNIFERFKHGFPLMLHGVSLFGIALIDRFILEKYTNFKVVGSYSFIYIFASSLVFLYSIVSIFQEKKIYKSDSYPVLLSNVKKTLFFMFVIGFVGSILSFLFYFILIYFNFVHGYGIYYSELVILIIAHLILPIYLVSNYILIQNNKPKLLLFCSLFAFAINALFNFLFIPKFELVGAVWATLIANIFLVALSAYLSFKIMQDRRFQ